MAYTDGVTEPEDAYGEMFGEEAPGDILLKIQEHGADEIISRAMERWCNGPDRRNCRMIYHADRAQTLEEGPYRRPEREVDPSPSSAEFPAWSSWRMPVADRRVPRRPLRSAFPAAHRGDLRKGKQRRRWSGRGAADLYPLPPRGSTWFLTCDPAELTGEAAANFRMLTLRLPALT